MKNSFIPSTQKVNWKEVLTFYIVAVAVSAPFRLNLIQPAQILPLPYGLNIFYRVLRGIGPAAGFLVMLYILKSNAVRANSFWGLNKIYSALSVLVIPIGLTLVGVNNDWGLDKNYYGFLTGMMLILYALAEEYGWRGYLQQALLPLPLPYRIVAIAVLWYVWHLNFLLPNISVQMHVVHFLSLVLGSWGLLKITESTYSILFAAAVHLSFNILSDVDADFRGKVIIVILGAVVWTILIISLSKRGKPLSQGPFPPVHP
jgi:hypothetical protein